MKKRIFISILTVLILLLSAPVTIHANAILGDANLDSVLDVNDAYAILEHSASIGAGNGGTLFDKALISADFSADDKISAKDAFKILVYLSKSGQPVPNGLNQIDTEEWRQVYTIQLDNFQSYKNRYELADINSDSIPELFIMLGDTSETIVYTYQNGSCQQIHFPTNNGAIDTWCMYTSSEFDGLFAWYYPNAHDIAIIYEIDENLQAIPKHELIKDHVNDSYYFDDTPITKETYYHYHENIYQLDPFYDTENRDLLTIYGTGKLKANFIKNSIKFEKGWLKFQVDCNHITEKSNITFHVVPHGTEHILKNAIEYTDTEFYRSSLYEAIHIEFYRSSLYEAIHNDNAYCVLGEIPAGDYDLFMLTDDGTELDSITFEVK